MEFLQGAFESYKSSLHQEMHDKWKVKEEDLKRDCEQAKQTAIHDMSKIFLQFVVFFFNCCIEEEVEDEGGGPEVEL